jgi:hypothetical protein
MILTKRTILPSLIIYIVLLPIYLYSSGFREGIVEWLIFASLIALPIFASLSLGKTDKAKSTIYKIFNLLILIGVIIMEFTADCSGMCFRGILTGGTIIYWLIMTIIFSFYLDFTNPTKKTNKKEQA